MNAIFIFGPHAVGKMTIGQELSRLTSYPLLHNHMTIELGNEFFTYGTEKGIRLVHKLRDVILEEVVDSELPGFIRTVIWAFDLEKDWKETVAIKKQFEDAGHQTYFVELEATMETRLERNKTENRLFHKPSKRNLDRSENDMKKTFKKYRMNSEPGEIKFENYLRINTEKLPPKESAELIVKTFNL